MREEGDESNYDSISGNEIFARIDNAHGKELSDLPTRFIDESSSLLLSLRDNSARK
jgi:hypothetical protein